MIVPIQACIVEQWVWVVATSLQTYPNMLLVTWIKLKTGHFGRYNSDIELQNAI
jgi:hypothetical protein